MYSTCIFCHSSLGFNQVIEAFPVGHRLAFDSAKGRLWAVCTHCERWNLTPIEERWEAIEDCERNFRSVKTRVSTREIGLARLEDGSELVRIGKPLLPEHASWRYGDQFGTRRARNLATSAALVAGIALFIPYGLLTAGSCVFAGLNAYFILDQLTRQPQRLRTVAKARSAEGKEVLIRGRDAEKTIIVSGTSSSQWGLLVPRWSPRISVLRVGYPVEPSFAEFRGEAALQVAGRILPIINSRGAPQKRVREAVANVESYPEVDKLFNRAARLAERASWRAPEHWGSLSKLPPRFGWHLR